MTSLLYFLCPTGFVASLTSVESKEALIRDLLAYLPLLNPKNSEVKALYLNLIPKVLKYTLDHCALMEEARQLLSYSLIHPAFTVEDRGLEAPHISLTSAQFVVESWLILFCAKFITYIANYGIFLKVLRMFASMGYYGMLSNNSSV